MRRLKEEDIILRNMVKLAQRDPKGGAKFAKAVLDVLPNDQPFTNLFVKTMKGRMPGWEE